MIQHSPTISEDTLSVSGSDSETAKFADQLPSKAKSRWLSKRLGLRLAILVILLFGLWRLNLDPALLLNSLMQANLWLVAAALALLFPILVVKTYRWQLISAQFNIKLSFKLASRIYAAGMSAGSFTPGQSGDAIKALYLADMGYNFSQSFLTVVIDRLYDVLVLLTLAILGFVVLGSAFAGMLPILLAFIVGTVCLLLMLLLPAIRNRLVSFALKLLNKKQAKVEKTLADKTDTSQTFSEPAAPTTLPPTQTFKANQKLTTKIVIFLIPLILTLVTAFLAVVRSWLLATSIGMNFSLLQIIAISSVSTVVSLLPISVGGIGVRDQTLVGILTKLDYSKESAIVLSTLMLLLNLFNLCLGYNLWLLKAQPKQKPVVAESCYRYTD